MKPGVYEFKKDIFLKRSSKYFGVVLTPSGQPVKYAKLEFVKKEVRKKAVSTVYAYTKSDGSFCLSGCFPGEYNVYIRKLGWLDKLKKIDVVTKIIGEIKLHINEEDLKLVVDTGKSDVFYTFYLFPSYLFLSKSILSFSARCS